MAQFILEFLSQKAWSFAKFKHEVHVVLVIDRNRIIGRNRNRN